jgi:hypothetical protein
MFKPTEINTGFRTIRLTYKDSNAELTSYEIDLIEKYKKIHEDCQIISAGEEGFATSFSELMKMLQEAKKQFEPLKKLQKEVTSFQNIKIPRKDVSLQKKIQQTVDLYNLKSDILRTHVLSMNDKMTNTYASYADVYKKDEDFKKQCEIFNNFQEELYNHQENYNIDINQWQMSYNHLWTF